MPHGPFLCAEVQCDLKGGKFKLLADYNNETEKDRVWEENIQE